MKVRISELRAAINKFLTEALAEIEQEDVDRLRRAKDGYGETEFEEDVDRLRRAADGYGESEFEENADTMSMAFGEETCEASLATSPPQAQSQKGPKRDKSQMQGVGPRPTMATAFGDEPKKEASLATAPPTAQSMKGTKKDKSQMQGVGPKQTLAQVFGSDESKKEAAGVGPQNPGDKLKGASASAALHSKDKSQMQGVGPRPTMANAFDDLGSKKKLEVSMTDKTNPQPGVSQQQAKRKADLDAAKQKKIDKHVKGLEKDSQAMASKEPQKFKFSKEPNGDFALSRLDLEASVPSDEEELFISKNKADFKKRYGKAYKDRLYAKAKEKYRK